MANIKKKSKETHGFHGLLVFQAFEALFGAIGY